MQQVMITTRGKFSAVGSGTNQQQWGKAQAAAAMQCSDHARGPSLLQQLCSSCAQSYVCDHHHYLLYEALHHRHLERSLRPFRSFVEQDDIC